MARFPHFLRAPKRGAQPSKCLWVDTETKPTIDDKGVQHHRLNFGWAAYQNQHTPKNWTDPEWLRFTTTTEFWDFTVSHVTKGKKLYVFAHNGAFDLPVLAAFTELPARGWQLVKAVCDAPPIILTWRKDKMTIIFIDTLNIWRMSLAKIGEGYGIPKLPMPLPDASIEEWDRYGKNDCDIIRVAVIGWLAFLLDNDLGPFASTLASQALKTYKYRFMREEIFIDNNERATEIARASYVGGRTECFKLGTFKDNLYYLDVNSMYPAVMKDNEYPTKLRAVYVMPEEDEVEEWRNDYLLIGDVTICTDSPDYPVVSESKLLFPTGTFRTTLAHPELLRAWDRGHVTLFHSAALYDKAPLFAEFVDTLYRLRQEAAAAGNETAKFNLKILMNSLYGKFGQRGRRYEECGTTDPNEVWTHTEIDMDTDSTIRYRAFGGLVQAFIDEAESMESHPAIAACVTSNARIILLDAIERCGRENVFYCDTDSIIVNDVGFVAMRGLIDNKKLGAWKLEKEIKELTIHGPKDYVMDGAVKIKGIRGTAINVAHNTYEQDKFVGFRGLLQRGSLAEPLVLRIRKKLKRVYTKGTVLPSGTVRPLTLGRAKGRRGRKRG